MTHASMRASHDRGSTEPRDGSPTEEAERPRAVDEQRPVDRSRIGWRYGSALAAARALNARPARA